MIRHVLYQFIPSNEAGDFVDSLALVYSPWLFFGLVVLVSSKQFVGQSPVKGQTRKSETSKIWNSLRIP